TLPQILRQTGARVLVRSGAVRDDGPFLRNLGEIFVEAVQRNTIPIGNFTSDCDHACGLRVSMNTKSSPASILLRKSSTAILRLSGIKGLLRWPESRD